MLHIQEAGRGSPVLIATRQSLTWAKGPPPSLFGYEAGHTCPAGENSLCVNPAHLAWQTREENEQWKQSKRREMKELGDAGAFTDVT